MKGSQLEQYKKNMSILDQLENKHQKIVGIIFTLLLAAVLVLQIIFNKNSFDEQLHLILIISVQIALMTVLNIFYYVAKQPSKILIIIYKLVLNTMTIVPIEIIIQESQSERIIWYSFIVGVLVVGISICMKNQLVQIISIFVQSFYLILRFTYIKDIGLAYYLIHLAEVILLSSVILYICQDYGKAFLMDYFVENTKGNTAKSVIKSSLPLPVFATKLKTKNLDSSRLLMENLDNLELDIVFANKFCRQIFNIKKKLDMKQKLKYLFMQGESNNSNNNNSNNLSNEPIRNEFDRVFEGTEYYCGSPEFRQRMSIKNQDRSHQPQYAKLNPTQQPYKNDFYNLQRSQIDSMSPIKDANSGIGMNGITVGEKLGSHIQNGKEFHINPISIELKNSESQQQIDMKEKVNNINKILNSKALIDGFMQQNQQKKQTMTQQFLKQNFTKQEIKDYGMTGSQQTSLLYYHILEKLYSCLFNRLRSEANGENIGTKQKAPKNPIFPRHPTSIKDLTPHASQVFDQQQEEVFLDVMYVDSEKKRKKYFDIKIIEVEWENENAIMVIMNDISEKMRVKRMKEIDSFKNDILSTITHNLKTPLNGIILIAQSLQNQVNPKIKDAFSDILQNSKMLLYMINDILDYSRLSKGNIHLNLETFSLHKLINEVLSIYKRQTQQKNIKLNYVLMGNLQTSCRLINDFNRIKQILINLVGNAAKCTFDGSITLIFEISSPNLLLISIKDTGIGMSNDIIRSIQKIQMNKKKDMRHGVGIGLLIGKSLLQLVGPDKEFRIESQENQGSTFSFQVFLIHKKSKSNNTEGLEISHIQNFFQIDKSMGVGYDGANNSIIYPKANYNAQRSRINRVNTILEEVKPTEENNIKIDFKECISQRMLPDEGGGQLTKNGNFSPRNTEIHDTQQNFLSHDYHSRKNTGDFYENLKRDPISIIKQKIQDSNSNFNYSKKYFTENGQINNLKFQKQDQDFNNLLKVQKGSHNQISMEEFEDNIFDDENVAKKYTENHIHDLKTKRVRVLPYHTNSTQQNNQEHHDRKLSGFEYPSTHLQENFFSNELSPTIPFQVLHKNSCDSSDKYIDSNQETIPQNLKLNFYLNSHLTDSIYTQDSRAPDNNNNNSLNINKSQKNNKLSQYNSNSCQSTPPQLSLRQSQSNQIQRYSFLYSDSNDTIISKEKQKQGDQRDDFNVNLNNNCSCLNSLPKQGVCESSNNSTNANFNSKQNVVDYTPVSTTAQANNTPISPLRDKIRIRQQSFSENREKQLGGYQNQQFLGINNIFKFNSNVNLEESKKGCFNNNLNGQGRLYEYIEESRDQDEYRLDNLGETSQKVNGLNKFHTIHSSTTLTVEKNNINMTISQNIPLVNMKLCQQPQTNYKQSIIEYFESAQRNILIVDDTVFNIKALRNLLLKYKISNIEEAFNGLQAVQKVQQAQFDLIFMDINMPVMDGFEATKQIRELQKESKIQYNPIIIIVTAFGDQENKMLSFQSGADEHIEKPLTLDSIQKTIYSLIRR